MSEYRQPSDAATQPYIDRNLGILTGVLSKTVLIGEDVSSMLTGMNCRLALLADEIKAHQENKPGAITLHLRPCSVKGCLGCPHPTFYRWYNPSKGRDKTQYTATQIDKPLYYMRRQDRFDEVRPLVKEAVALIELRTKFIKQLSSLNKSLVSIHREHPNLLSNNAHLDDAIAVDKLV